MAALLEYSCGVNNLGDIKSRTDVLFGVFCLTMSGNSQQHRVRLRRDVYKPGQLVRHELQKCKKIQNPLLIFG